jgi:hypothetical protein
MAGIKGEVVVMVWGGLGFGEAGWGWGLVRRGGEELNCCFCVCPALFWGLGGGHSTQP